jgi:RNA polymerase sigma-70 factor, ECF subfamily
VRAEEAELVRRCRDGDRDAWAEFVERYSRYVYSIAVRAYRLSETDAEDVFQEVFARAYQHLRTLRDDTSIRPWIAQLTRNLAIDHLRASGKIELSEAPPELPSQDRTMEDLAEAMTVRDALASLDATCQEMLDRFYARDQARKTISAELGIPDGTIASRISRCLDKLRSALEVGASPAPATREA